jgi:capsular polysaccharide biosynthesis protein
LGDGKCLKLDDAIEVDGRAMVMLDDVGNINYCHWLCDWLPRLAALPTVLEDTYVVVLGCKTSWQLETLRAFGFPPRRIISLANWQAVRARELIVPSYLSDVIHPAYRGARWALDFLNRKLDTLPGELEDAPRRVYFSRADATGRQIENEDAFAAYLQTLGYQTFVASGMSVAAQARLFRSAASIVSLHGAGLTNIVFCRPGCKVLEIMPDN